ncbi:MAG: M15 family metallopeptidase [Erysipelotrichaceae bacterium]
MQKKTKKVLSTLICAIVLSAGLFFSLGYFILFVKGYNFNQIVQINSALSYGQILEISSCDYYEQIDDLLNDQQYNPAKTKQYLDYLSGISESYELNDVIKIVNKELDYPYSKKLAVIVNDPYFIDSLIDRYLNYESEDYQKIVAAVNSNIDYPYYTNTKPADLSQGELVLINKYNYLDENYVPDDIVDVDLYHSYSGNSLAKVAFDNYIVMHSAALKDGIQLILFSGYRSYQLQDDLWTSRSDSRGIEYADEYTARAGYSEHQTGLALDITRYDSDDVEEAYCWLADNSYKYGFILRYPQGKEDITGYSYEPWHFRYVGKEVAQKIYEKNITFDEYYAYYINNN